MPIPSPVPSTSRFLFSSMRLYGEKSFSISSCFIPIPVSSTEKIRQISSSLTSVKSTCIVTEPFSVYLTAFVSIFITHCLMRISSPIRRCGICAFTSTINFNPFLAALSFIILFRSLIRDDNSYWTGMSSIFPASTLERSRMSLIRESSVLPADIISVA